MKDTKTALLELKEAYKTYFESINEQLLKIESTNYPEQVKEKLKEQLYKDEYIKHSNIMKEVENIDITTDRKKVQ